MKYPSILGPIIVLLITAAIIAEHSPTKIALLGAMIALVCAAVIPLPLGRPKSRSLLQWIGSRIVRLPNDRLSPRMRPSLASTIISTAPRGTIVRDLLGIFLIALVVRCIWAVVVPPWQAPDEPDHYVYAAHIGEQYQIPHPPFEKAPYYSTEVTTSWMNTFLGGISGVGASSGHDLPYLPVAYDYRTARDYEAPHQDRLSSAGARATSYPPLYYLLEAIPYRLLRGAPLLSRLYAMRLITATLGALSCVFAYLMAYELRCQRRWGWTLGLCMALMPMYVFATSTINNDAAMYLGVTALIWLLIRIYQRNTVSRSLTFALGLVSGLSLLAKPTVFPLTFLAGSLILIKIFPAIRAFWLRAREEFLALGAYAAGGLMIYSPWVAFSLYYYGNIGFATVPATALFRLFSGAAPVAAASNPVAAAIPTTSAPLSVISLSSLWSYLQFKQDGGWDHYHWLLIRSFWGNFGWLDAPMPDWIFRPIGIFYLVGIAGLAIQLALQPARRRGLLLLLSLVVAQALFIFVVIGYWESARIGSDIGLQGRYFFPILAPLLFLLLSGWDHLLGERPFALRVAPYLMLALNLVGLATLLSRYYGVTIG